MKKYWLLSWVLLGCISHAYTQQMVAGPVIGAVKDKEVKIFYFTDIPVLSTVYFISAQGDTSKYIYHTHFEKRESVYPNMIEYTGLKPDTKYNVHIYINANDSIYQCTFRTLPAPGTAVHFTFTLGSCTEQHYKDSIFIEMDKHHPLFFLHLGDWLYANNFNEEKFYYNQSMEHQRELYMKRYEMPFLRKMLETTPVDFVFDDEDGVFDDYSKYSYTSVQVKDNKTIMEEISYPDSLLKMAVDGRKTFFPAYSPFKDRNVAYHSFVSGNAEFFFLDTRSTRSPNSEVFTKKGDYYIYKVPEQHAILDAQQLTWLLDGLKNSKAQWKFIVSGTTFNTSYKQILDITMLKRVQNRKLPNDMTGAYVAASLSSMWFAFPETQAALLNFCHDHQIKNVIVLSGDAHTAAIDDGTNAGFPELMAGGLAQKNSKLASIIYNNLHLNLWNQGGQGIQNNNFNDAFGKVEVNGNESVTLSCVDKYGQVICSYTVKDGFIPAKAAVHKKISLGDKIKAAKQALKIKQAM